MGSIYTFKSNTILGIMGHVKISKRSVIFILLKLNYRYLYIQSTRSVRVFGTGVDSGNIPGWKG